MIQAQLHGMEGLPRQLDGQLAATAVGGIPHHRVVAVGAVHPDLVGAAGVELEAQQRVVAQSFLQAPVGAGVAAVFATHHRIFLAVDGVAANGSNDRAAFAGWHPMHHGEVFAGGHALLDLHLQLHQGLLALGDHDAAGGVFIEPVHDPRPQLAADAR